MPKQRHIGVLKTYDPVKGYGFITRPVGKDVFIFYGDFKNKSDSAALPGTSLEFEIVEKKDSNRPRAVNVTIVG